MNTKNILSRGLASLLIGAGSLVSSPLANSYSYADEVKTQAVQADKNEKTAENLRKTYITLMDYVKEDKIAEKLEKTQPEKYKSLIQLEKRADEEIKSGNFSLTEKDYVKAVCDLTKSIKLVLNKRDSFHRGREIFSHIDDYKTLMVKSVEDNLNQKNYLVAKQILESNEEAFMDTYMCNAEMRYSSYLHSKIDYLSGEIEKQCKKIFGKFVGDSKRNPVAGEITIKSEDKTLKFGYSFVNTIYEPKDWYPKSGENIELWVNNNPTLENNLEIYVIKLKDN